MVPHLRSRWGVDGWKTDALREREFEGAEGVMALKNGGRNSEEKGVTFCELKKGVKAQRAWRRVGVEIKT